jgi:hypothetical protein
VQAALTAWNSPDQHDNAAQGRVGFMPLGTIKDVRNLRAQDTATFLTEHQKKFFEETISFLRKDLGYKALIHGSNWITADGRVLGPLDKYSNTVADFMDRHGYYEGLHEGERASYSISKGDKYNDRAAVAFDPKSGSSPDFGLPIMDIQYNGLPSTISEINWTPPNRFRADLPLLAASYGALQGTDGFFFFALSGPSWQEVLGKFSIQTPVAIGQFRRQRCSIVRAWCRKPTKSWMCNCRCATCRRSKAPRFRHRSTSMSSAPKTFRQVRPRQLMK